MIKIRLFNNQYVEYDEFLKKYINMTAYMLTEDMRTTPFKRIKTNYKNFRKCLDSDYERTQIFNYTAQVKNVLDGFREYCVDNWEGLKLLAQKSGYKYSYFRYDISMCDPNNAEGIVCETDPKLIYDLVENLRFQIYSFQVDADIQSNLPEII